MVGAAADGRSRFKVKRSRPVQEILSSVREKLDIKIKKPRFQLQRMCAYFDRAATGMIPVGKLQSVLQRFNIALDAGDNNAIWSEYGAGQDDIQYIFYEPLILAIFPTRAPPVEKTVATAGLVDQDTVLWGGLPIPLDSPAAVESEKDTVTNTLTNEGEQEGGAQKEEESTPAEGAEAESSGLIEEGGNIQKTKDTKSEPNNPDFHQGIFATPDEDIEIEEEQASGSTTKTDEVYQQPHENRAHGQIPAAAGGSSFIRDVDGPQILEEKQNKILYFNIEDSRAKDAIDSDGVFLTYEERPPTASHFQEMIKQGLVYKPDVPERPSTTSRSNKSPKIGRAIYTPRYDKAIASRGNLASRGGTANRGGTAGGGTARMNTAASSRMVFASPQTPRPMTGIMEGQRPMTGSGYNQNSGW